MTKNHLPPLTTNGRRTRIAVGMSGGVDSNTTAYMLHEMGFEIIGFTAWTLNGPGKCCNDALVNAGRVCEQLGIPYDTVDLRAEFTHYVMDYYNASYAEGLTPNPCVECNRHVKWEALVNYARQQLDVDYVATGHYAQVMPDEQGHMRVFRAVDQRKDQTYMMARVRPEDYKFALFPLGGMTKDDTRAVARKAELPEADGKESQDVCFVLDGHANYMKGVFGPKVGNIIDIDRDNKVIRQHEGFFNYTVGQRKGLGGGADRPVYVVKVDPKTNTVFVGDKHHLETSTITVQAPSWLHTKYSHGLASGDTLTSMVKYRYNSPPVHGTIKQLNDELLTVELSAPASAVTPGQIAAFYDEDFNELWGGGYIERFLPHGEFDRESIVIPVLHEPCPI